MFRRGFCKVVVLASLVSCHSLHAQQSDTQTKPSVGEEAAGASEAPPAASGSSSPVASVAEDSDDSANREEYYELLLVLADTIDQIDRNYVEPISRRELVEAAIAGILKKLDPFSNYIPSEDKEDFEDEIENEFGGIGIQISSQRGHLQVISPLVGTPAHRGGIMAGDRILAVNGNPTRGLTLSEAVDRMKGRAGTSLTLTVLHPHNGTTEEVTLTREVIRVETVMGDTRGDAEGAWEFMYDDQRKIGYVRVTAFSKHTADDLRAALTSLADREMRGLVLDLRFNPGGLLSSAIEVSDMFLSSGKIVSTSGRNVRERVWEARSEATFEGFEMVVLVNQYSASASEIVAACLQDHKRAVIVGQRSWGKGSVQNVIQLEDGQSALKLTTASYMRPSGKNIHRFTGAKNGDWGVGPDDGFEVPMTDEEIGQLLLDRRSRDIVQDEKQAASDEGSNAEPFVDRQLQKALEYLHGRLGKNE